MAKTILATALALACLIFPTHSNSLSPPAIYVFGDSAVDAGNNNFLDVPAKADFPPYGIDFPGGAATGRFTNGYTFVDFIAQWFGQSFPAPIMDGQSTKSANTKGFNYASGAAGILVKTCNVTPLCLGKQVDLFKKSVKEYLPSLPMYENKAAQLSGDISKSLFIVHMGSNDYILNYFSPNGTAAQQHNPEQFADLLVTELGKSLQDLYNLGSRKILVFGIAPLGCVPSVLDAMKTKTRCVESVNDVVEVFNKKLEAELKQLGSTLKGSLFIMANPYNLTREILKNPSSYGFKETKKPCCASADGTGPCKRNQVPCKDRKSYQYWDFGHPTQAVYELFARKCFNGTGLCTPMNIVQLVQKCSLASKKKLSFQVVVIVIFCVLWNCYTNFPHG